MDEKRSLTDLREHLAEIERNIKEMSAEYDGRDFSLDDEEKWEALKVERAETTTRIAKREQRENDIRSLLGSDDNTESDTKFSFQTRKASAVPDDPTDMDEYRVRARNINELEQAYRDGAKHIIESRYRPALAATMPKVFNREDAQNDAEYLVNLDQETAHRFIITSSPRYKDEFGTFIRTQGRVVGQLMERAASLTTTAGGYAVPVELDNTLLLTNVGVINPVRGIAKVRQTNVNTYEFLNTTGITAGYGAEATEASDNAPTFALPTVNIEKAFAFVPMSIEIAQDYANIQGDLAMCFADSKNRLESTKFLTGLGHGSNEPQGLIAAGGATAVVSSATTAVFAVADLYSLQAALSPRYRANASFVMNLAAGNKIRQFDTSGGASLWTQLQFGSPADLLGRPAYEWSDYSSAVTTSGSTIVTFGDFNYFGIVDRVGLNVEFIQHLFATANNRPSGQRGLYAYWRNSTQVLSPTVQVNSAFVSLKLL